MNLLNILIFNKHMSFIYLTNKSKKILINNIFDIPRPKSKDIFSVTLIKKYINVYKLLSKLNYLINDINNIVYEYLNDVILIDYKFDWKCYIDESIKFCIQIKSNNVSINCEQYNFEY